MAATTSITGLAGLLTTVDISMHEDTFQRLTPNDEQAAAIATMRSAFGLTVAAVLANVPEGPDRTYVIRQLRTCAMWCNMSITHQPDGSPRE
jgi:hypothetical protein